MHDQREMHDLFANMCYHKFQNLNTIDLYGVDPSILLHQIPRQFRNKLENLSLSCRGTIMLVPVIPFIYDCINLKNIHISGSALDFSVIHGSLANPEQKSVEFNKLECIETNIITMLALKSEFYHLITNSSLRHLNIQDFTEFDEDEETQVNRLFCSDDFGVTQVSKMLAHLKSFSLEIMGLEGLHCIRNIGQSVVHSVSFALDEFKVCIDSPPYDSDHDNINSVNLYESLDVIVANSTDSILSITFDTPFLIHSFAKQFRMLYNKQKHAFKTIKFTIPNHYYHEELLNAYLQNTIQFDAVSEAEIFDDDMWFEYQLDCWMELCSPRCIANFSDFGVKKFDLLISWYDKLSLIAGLREELGNFDPQWILDFETAMSNRVDYRMRDYGLPYTVSGREFKLIVEMT